ncbi:hypothetical protein QAD02_011603 [Eretmocerus hayati]|uniref:Uncharacterized protein n=1 Tax=Eretmocerus hayati TaxID=131215 RepID=A0ACC2NXI4_9HYME|nr:hypothetical protein QAD02_011603 [Eretmocerus hayati]
MTLVKEKELIKKGLMALKDLGNFENLLESPLPPRISELASSRSLKSIEAEHYRLKGNELFTKNDHDICTHYEIINYYNTSIAAFPLNSEIQALAYGNRSAILEHIERYNESIIAIDRALKITQSLPLKIKLLCRKAKCAAALGLSNEMKYLVQAKSLLDKISEVDEIVEYKMEQNQGEKPQRAPDLRQMSGSAGESQSEVTSTPATHSSCKNVKPDYALKMDHILRDLNSLERQVKLCKAKSREELEYLYIEEMLTVQLVELDKIDLAGNESAKRRRRRLVVKTNTIIALLESKVPEIEQPPQQSNQQPQPEKENRQPQSQSDQDQEERRQHLIQQQVEKIQEYMERLDSDNVEEEVAGEAVGDASTTPSTEPSTSATSPSDSGLRKPRKTREALWHDDFPFKFDKTSGNGTSHLNCVKAGKKSLKCPVRLKIDAAGNRVVTGIHNHTPPKGGEKKVKFYAALRKAVQTERTDFISIYHRVAAEAEYADTAIEFPPRVVERSMHRWRAAVRKKGSGKVRNVDDYVKFFETPEGQALLEYDPPNNRKLSYKVIIEEVETKKGKKYSNT